MTSVASDPQTPLLALRGISKAFPGVRANDGVDLTILPGRIHALLGENGAGKSTLVRMIYGLMKPDAGEILWDGARVDVTSPKVARRLGIGMVMQHFSLVKALTVFDNIALTTESGTSRAALRARVMEIAGRYGLDIHLDKMVADISMGERQRVEIIRALLPQPRLLIMDEPTSVLAPQEVEALFKVLRTLVAEGMAALYISHKLHEIMQLCDTVSVLRMGRLVSEGRTAEESVDSLATKMIGARLKTLSRPAPGEPGSIRLNLERVSTPAQSTSGAALNDITFSVRAGEILGIAGIAGNGQAALEGALSGEIQLPATATISVDGQDARQCSPARRRALGLRTVPEERQGHSAVGELPLVDNALLTVWGQRTNVRAGLMNFGGLKTQTRKIIADFDVRTTGPDAEAQSLSGGNLQKFVVGREVLQSPGVLVVSQPTWGVDAGAAIAIHQALVDLAAKGAAIVIISQDLDELMAVSTHLAVLSNGLLSPARPTPSYDALEVGRLMGSDGSSLQEGAA